MFMHKKDHVFATNAIDCLVKFVHYLRVNRYPETLYCNFKGKHVCKMHTILNYAHLLNFI